MTSSHHDVPPCQWFSRLAAFLDRRSAPRLTWAFFGAVLARGRAWRRESLADEISGVLRPGVTENEIRAVAERLLSVAA